MIQGEPGGGLYLPEAEEQDKVRNRQSIQENIKLGSYSGSVTVIFIN
jgi:hypothetical protein